MSARWWNRKPAHGQTDSSTTHRTIPFVKNLETSQETFLRRHLMNWTICLTFQFWGATRSTGFCLACLVVLTGFNIVQIPDGCGEHSRFGLSHRHSQHPLPNLVQSKQIPAFLRGEKELDHTSNSPTFLGAAQSPGFCLTCLRALMRPDILQMPGGH